MGNPIPDMMWDVLSRQVQRFARRRVADRDIADDIAQEAVARTFTHFGPRSDDPALPRWAYRTARNLIIDRYRRGKSDGTAEVEMIASVADAEDPARDQERSLGSCASAMLARLEPPYRQAVTLADFEGVGQHALAERLGVSVSGLKSRVQRGRAKLRGMLLDCCRIDFDRRGNVVDHRCTDRSSEYCAD